MVLKLKFVLVNFKNFLNIMHNLNKFRHRNLKIDVFWCVGCEIKSLPRSYQSLSEHLFESRVHTWKLGVWVFNENSCFHGQTKRIKWFRGTRDTNPVKDDERSVVNRVYKDKIGEGVLHEDRDSAESNDLGRGRTEVLQLLQPWRDPNPSIYNLNKLASKIYP